MDYALYEPLFSLLDAILGHNEIASYYFWEARTMKDGGTITEKDGKSWTLKTVDDLRKYLEESSK
jgi:hypothetical protein